MLKAVKNGMIPGAVGVQTRRQQSVYGCVLLRELSRLLTVDGQDAQDKRAIYLYIIYVDMW